MIRNIGGDKIEKKKRSLEKKKLLHIYITQKRPQGKTNRFVCTVYAHLFLTLYLFSIHDFHFCRAFWYSLSRQLSHQLTSVLKFVNLFRHSSLLPLLDFICDEISMLFSFLLLHLNNLTFCLLHAYIIIPYNKA